MDACCACAMCMVDHSVLTVCMVMHYECTEFMAEHSVSEVYGSALLDVHVSLHKGFTGP